MESTVNTAIEYLRLVTCHIDRADPPGVIMAILLELGFSPDSEGFNYLCEAIELKVNDRKLHLSEIYQAIEGRYDSSMGYFQIDQAIRSVIKSAWIGRKEEKWIKLFSAFTQETEKRPSNFKFICYVTCLVILLKYDHSWHPFGFFTPPGNGREFL